MLTQSDDYDAQGKLEEPQLIGLLERFNRKERNWLIRDALGDGSKSLCENFLKRVKSEVHFRDPKFDWEEPFWWGTDYHLDWLIAVLTCMQKRRLISSKEVLLNEENRIRGSQQDLDFLIASGKTLILIEAKGVGDWKGEDFQNKVNRLIALSENFLNKEGKTAGLRLHFFMCSPGECPTIETEGWPDWMTNGDKPRFIGLTPPLEDGYLRVGCCDEKRKPSAHGGHWRIIPTRVS
jgi:hypothetical protein